MTSDGLVGENHVSFTRALRTKYCQQDDYVDVFCMPKDPKISTEIAFVGFDRVALIQKELRQLTSIDLSGMKIGSVGDFSADLKNDLRKISIMNLAENLLDWHQVVALVDHIPSLRELILTKNKLGSYKDDFQKDEPPKRILSSLTLGYSEYTWTTLIGILNRIWHRIDSLDLWKSDLTDEKMILVEYSDTTHRIISSIKSLRLSHNKFTTINWVDNLGPITGLVELDLSSCDLKSIEINDEIVHKLASLQTLNISNNQIASWESVSSLNRLSSLASLICHQNPFFLSEKLAKPLTIGRIAKLKFLNREEVNTRIRRDSEILYLRKISLEYYSIKDDEMRQFTEYHPRFKELAEIYGIPENPNLDKVANKYVHVSLHYQDLKIAKKLPLDMRISNLRMLCKRLFKLRSNSSVRIICHNIKERHQDDIQYELDRDAQTLSFFSVVDGCELLVEESIQ